jgi:hypothetical protein
MHAGAGDRYLTTHNKKGPSASRRPKSREETPKEGGGGSGRSSIPRCTNMLPHRTKRKRHWLVECMAVDIQAQGSPRSSLCNIFGNQIGLGSRPARVRTGSRQITGWVPCCQNKSTTAHPWNRAPAANRSLRKITPAALDVERLPRPSANQPGLYDIHDKHPVRAMPRWSAHDNRKITAHILNT